MRQTHIVMRFCHGMQGGPHAMDVARQRMAVRKVMPPRMKPGALEMVTGQSRPFLKRA